MTMVQDTLNPPQTPPRRSSEWKTIVILILLIPVLWSPPFLVRYFLYQPFNIPSGSMTPTLVVGDYVFAAKYAYGYSRYSFPGWLPAFTGRIFAAEPARGDVVVFRSPKDSKVDYVKRVVGLPGDRIQMQDGQLVINDKPARRERLEDSLETDACLADTATKVKRWRETLPGGASYVTYDCADNAFLDNTIVYTVPPGHFFMLGDNRDNSSDSRAMSTMGFVPLDHLIGRVNRIFWSMDDDEEPRFERFGMKVE